MVESNCAVRSQARTVIGDLLLCKFDLGLELKALGSRVVTEPVGPKLARGLGHLRTQLSKLLVHTRIKGSPLVVEGLPRPRNRYHQRHGPSTQGSYDELHCVHGLKPLHPARSADQPYHLVCQIRRVAVREELKPVQRILERAAHRFRDTSGCSTQARRLRKPRRPADAPTPAARCPQERT